jgi:nucleotide-binding universal stress UspA family protein
METILCPTDFSPSSRNAIRYADQLAHWMQARMILFHNIYEPVTAHAGSYGGVLYAEPIRDPGYRQARLARLNAWTNKLAIAGGSQPIRYESQIRYGVAQHNIAQEALTNRADLIVLGSKRDEGLKLIFSRSVVGEVIQQSPCPVLIIPPQATFKPLTRIVFATSLLGEDDADLSLIAQLAAAFQAQLLFLHIMTEYSAIERQEAEIIFNQFRQKLPDTNTDFYIETHQDIEEGISQFTRHHQADLLIIGYHPQSFWERILLGDHTQAIASHATLPVLIFHF